MKLNKNKIIAFSLAAILSVGGVSTTAYASQDSDGISAARTAEQEAFGLAPQSYSRILSLKGISSRYLSSYTRQTVFVGGVALSVKGVKINGIAYIPFKAAAEALGASYSYSSYTGVATVKASGLVFSAGNGCYVSYANDRALFSMSPNVVMNDGRLYIPAATFAKAVGMSVQEGASETRIFGSYKPLLHASKFYREDEVFWLARIIHAESQGEPLLGQIAVGNVVMNRVRSAYYPNTIYGVIFDRKYGVQFSPILNGTIYNNPGYNARLAAMICLEGYDVSEGAFFFLEPTLSSSSWIPNSRKYLYTIGHHDFYA